MTVSTNYLALSWSTSRGRDTYGYNICRLDARGSGQRFRTLGGGYDMVGTVVAAWLSSEYADRLAAIAHRAFYIYNPGAGVVRTDAPGALYGMTANYRNSQLVGVSLDGACGIESVTRIAAAIGVSISRNGNRKGHTVGFMVTDYGSADAMQAAGR